MPHNLFDSMKDRGLLIELEIQTLSERREGFLMEVGRSITASGFLLPPSA